MFTVPVPFSVVIPDVRPFRFSVPLVSVSMVATPPTVRIPPLKVVTSALPVTFVSPLAMLAEASESAKTTPPVMSAVSSPVTLTLPPAMLPVVTVRSP